MLLCCHPADGGGGEQFAKNQTFSLECCEHNCECARITRTAQEHTCNRRPTHTHARTYQLHIPSCMSHPYRTQPPTRCASSLSLRSGVYVFECLCVCAAVPLMQPIMVFGQNELALVNVPYISIQKMSC